MTDKNPSSSSPQDVPSLLKMEDKKPNILRRVVYFFTVLFLLVFLAFFILALVAPAVLSSLGLPQETAMQFVDYGWVMVLEALVGFVEVVSRYQDAPFQTAATIPGLVYMAVNASVAAAALWAIQLFGWTIVPGGTADPNVERWTKVLVAGLGAMAIFRSSLFVVGKGDKEVSIGPSAVLQILLDALDKEVDRFRGRQRAKSVKTIMADIHYEDAISDLTVISKALMQNLGDEETKKIEKLKADIEIVTELDPDVRKYLLGLGIMDIVGEEVLEQAIKIRGRDFYKQMQVKRREEEKADGSSEVSPDDALDKIAKKYKQENLPTRSQREAAKPNLENSGADVTDTPPAGRGDVSEPVG